MATQVLVNSKVWLAGYNLTGRLNAIGLTYAAELKDASKFGDSTRVNAGGLKAVLAEHAGHYESAGTDQEPDKVLFDRVGLVDIPMTIAPETGAEGEVGFAFRCAVAKYTPEFQLGELAKFTVSAQGSGGQPLVRGTVMHNALRSATANGTARQLGAVGATQKLYAALHVIAVTGTNPTLDVVIQSDDAQGFGTPTARITFAQQAAIGSAWATPVAGAITDDWWRVVWTIGGTGSPSFEFVVLVGIQ